MPLFVLILRDLRPQMLLIIKKILDSCYSCPYPIIPCPFPTGKVNKWILPPNSPFANSLFEMSILHLFSHKNWSKQIGYNAWYNSFLCPTYLSRPGPWYHRTRNQAPLNWSSLTRALKIFWSQPRRSETKENLYSLKFSFTQQKVWDAGPLIAVLKIFGAATSFRMFANYVLSLYLYDSAIWRTKYRRKKVWVLTSGKTMDVPCM